MKICNHTSNPETLQADILIYLVWQNKAGTVYWLADRAVLQSPEQKPSFFFQLTDVLNGGEHAQDIIFCRLYNRLPLPEKTLPWKWESR